MKNLIKNWKSILFALFLLGLLALPLAAQPARAQSNCTDPASGLPCTPTPPAGCFDVFGAPCTPTPPPPTCGLPGLPPCNTPVPPEPTDTPAPTRTPRPTAMPTRTPTATPTSIPAATLPPRQTLPAPETPTVVIVPTLPPRATLLPGITPQPTPTYRPSITGLISTIRNRIFNKPFDRIPDPFAEGNLFTITKVEITQAIQCLDNPNCPDNSVPLVTGKMALVRVYATIAHPRIGFINNIGGALCPGNTGNQGCANPIRPINRIVVFQVDNPSYVLFKNQRADLSLTLNFLVPAGYLSTPGQAQFTAYINYQREDRPHESVMSDNRFLVQAEVRQSKPLGLSFVVVQDHGEIANLSSIFPILDYIKASYPTGLVRFYVGGYLIGKKYAWNEAGSFCGKGFDSLLNDLFVLRGRNSEMYYGLVPDAGFAKAEGDTYGCGALPNGFVGGGLTSPLASKNQATSLTFIPKIAAHEIGHMSSLRHAPGCGASIADSTYPNTSGMLDETGVNVEKMRLYLPDRTFDFMGYCGQYEENSWISVHNTYKLLDALPKGAYVPLQLAALESVAPPASPAEVMLIKGSINPQSVDFDGGFFRMDGASAPPLTPNDGEFTVTAYDAGGNPLYVQNFAPMLGEGYGAHDEAQTGGAFVLVIPWQEGIRALGFSRQGVELRRVSASPNPPTVTFLTPAGGAAWGASGMQTLTWQSSDPDGDPLTYLLQFSPDDGRTWQTIAPNLTETSLQMDASFLPGAPAARFRVLASDGFHTAQSDSAPVDIASKPPVLNLQSPQPGAQVTQGSAVLLYAQALDLKDGNLGASAFTWSSDRDGILGTGEQIIVQNLSLGVHTLTVDAVNSAGLHALQSVQIEVVPVPPVLVEPLPGTDPALAWVLGLGGLLAAGVIVLAALALRRGRRR